MIRKPLGDLEQKGFFHLLSKNFLAQFLGFGTALLAARFLTPSEFGEIRIVQSYASVFAVLAGFGFNASVLKFCSERRDISEREGILHLAWYRSLRSLAAVLAVLVALSWWGWITSSSQIGRFLVLYSAGIPFLVFTELLSTFLQAMKRIKEMAVTLALVKVQSFIVIVASTWAWGVTGFICATVVAYAVGFATLLRQVGTRFLRGRQRVRPEGFSGIALYSVLANGVNMVGQYGDIYLLDHFSPDRVEIGYYSLATVLILGASQITGTVQAIAAPYFSERNQERDWFRTRLLRNQTKLGALSIVLALGIYGGAALIFPWFYGPSYGAVLPYLGILLVKYVIWSCYALVATALFGMGMVKLNLLTVAIGTPVGLLLGYLLLERIGVSGVAWAQVLAATLMFSIQIGLASALLRMKSSRP